MANKPRKKIDPADVIALAVRDCSNVGIAAHFDISVDTLMRRFSKELHLGREKGKLAIGTVLYDEAVNNRNTRLIEHLSKTRLKNVEQTNLELSGNRDNPIQHEVNYKHLSTDELIALESLLEKAASGGKSD